MGIGSGCMEKNFLVSRLEKQNKTAATCLLYELRLPDDCSFRGLIAGDHPTVYLLLLGVPIHIPQIFSKEFPCIFPKNLRFSHTILKIQGCAEGLKDGVRSGGYRSSGLRQDHLLQWHVAVPSTHREVISVFILNLSLFLLTSLKISVQLFSISSLDSEYISC